MKIKKDRSDRLDELDTSLAISADLERRTIYVVDEIDAEVTHRFLMVLDKLAEIDKPIRVVLNSNGGDVAGGFAIYDAIKGCGVPVVIDAYGEASSIAALILQAGTLRRMAPECRFMIHDGSINLGDVGAAQLISQAKEFETVNQRHNLILARVSGLTVAEVTAYCSKETYLSAEQCVGMGFADLVLYKNDWRECLRNPRKWLALKRNLAAGAKFAKKLTKALEAGASDPASTRLEFEDLALVLKRVRFKDKHIKLKEFQKPRTKKARRTCRSK